jgi:hypothetical protein
MKCWMHGRERRILVKVILKWVVNKQWWVVVNRVMSLRVP